MAAFRKFLLFNIFRLTGIHFKRKNKNQIAKKKTQTTSPPQETQHRWSLRIRIKVSLSLTTAIRTTLFRDRDITKLTYYLDIYLGLSET